MRPSTRKTLEAIAAHVGPTALKTLVAELRAAKPEQIEALLKAPAKAVAKSKAHARAKPAPDALATEVTAMLAPLLARSSEKAELLVEHLNKLTGRALDVKPAGLAATIKALRKALSDDDIRDGAYGLRVTMQREHSLREKVK
jgi:hypothetical protein